MIERRKVWESEEYDKRNRTRVDCADALGNANPSLESQLSSAIQTGMIDNFECSHEISNQFVLALGLGVSDNGAVKLATQ